MRHVLTACLLSCLVAFPALAAPPVARILGPTGGVPGDILVLDASESVDGEHFTWKVHPELPEGRPTILVLEQGRKCLVCSVPGAYTVFLAVANSEGIDAVKWTVTVGGPVPPGPTPPGPNPPPGPDLQGLAKFIYDAAMQVQSPTRQQEAAAMASNYRSIASRAAGLADWGPEQIADETRKANRASLDAGAQQRWATWAATMQSKLDALAESGELRTKEQYIAAWDEIASGLESVR